MRWLDQAAYTCARTYAETYCVTVYVGGIRFYKPINLSSIDNYRFIYSYHSGGYSRDFSEKEFQKKTHCIIIFVSVDENNQPQPVKPWIPLTEHEQEKKLEEYAVKLKALCENIHNEMRPFFNE